MIDVNHTDLLVARHGETEWNSTGKWQGSRDVPLNQTGIEQAQELAETLSSEDIRHIYSSDLSRARATAEIVRKRIGAFGVHEDARLRERNMGKFEGLTVEQVAKYMKLDEEKASELEYNELMMDGVPTVETWNDFSSRVWGSLYDIAGEHIGSKCLVVAHGGVLRSISMHLEARMGPELNYRNTHFIRLRFEGRNVSLINE